MHIALVADEERLTYEHGMLNRLCIALIDEGSQLTRLVPADLLDESIEEEEKRMALAARIAVPMRILPWMHRERAARLAAAFKSLPDVIYAVGEGAWSIALELAREIDRPVAIDLWSARQIGRVPRGRSASQVGCYVAATESIALSLREVVDGDLVSAIPFGVSIPSEPNRIFKDGERLIAISIVGSGTDVPAYAAMLDGLGRVLREYPQMQGFLELRGSHDHEIWRLASKRNLLGSISTITRAAQHRSLLLRCDVMLLPERFGDIRTIMLESMASGTVVAASADPARDMLINEETAMIVEEPSADQWTATLSDLLNNQERSREIGLAARSFVQGRHRSSNQANQLLSAFETMLGQESYHIAQLPH